MSHDNVGQGWHARCKGYIDSMGCRIRTVPKSGTGQVGEPTVTLCQFLSTVELSNFSETSDYDDCRSAAVCSSFGYVSSNPLLMSVYSKLGHEKRICVFFREVCLNIYMLFD
jgi:hypothetical protein